MSGALGAGRFGPLTGAGEEAERAAPGMASLHRLGNRYELVEEIGRGGIAVVYYARDHALGRIVAVKLLFPEFQRDPIVRERFAREVAATRTISSPHVVSLFDLHEVDGKLFLVMEYLPGPDLKRELIQAGGPLPLSRVIAIGTAACRALSAAHARGIVHRDVKPHNLLPDEAGTIKLVDFGLAQVEADIGLTTGSVILGTPEYAAPEVLGGQELDHRVDIYGLGATLYELATGRLPHRGASAYEVLHAHTWLTPPTPSSINPAIPAWLDAIIQRAMEKEVEERFATIDEMLAALAQQGHSGEVVAIEDRTACLSCGQDLPMRAPFCPRCGATVLREGGGDALLVARQLGHVDAERYWAVLGRFAGQLRPRYVARAGYARIAMVAGRRRAREVSRRLRELGFKTRTGFSSVPLPDEERERLGRDAMLLLTSAFAYLSVAYGFRLGYLAACLATVAAAAAVRRLRFPRLLRMLGSLVAPFAAPRLPTLLRMWSPTRRGQRRQRLLLWPIDAVPESGTWSTADLARIAHAFAAAPELGVAVAAPGRDRPEVLLHSVDADGATILKKLLEEVGFAAEIRRRNGDNDDLLTSGTMSAIFGISVVAPLVALLSLIDMDTLRRLAEHWIIIGVGGITALLFLAYFTRDVLLRLGGRQVGRRVRGALSLTHDVAPLALPEEVARGLRAALARTQGRRIGTTLRRVAARGFAILDALETAPDEVLEVSEIREPTLKLIAHAAEIADQAAALDGALTQQLELPSVREVVALRDRLRAAATREVREAIESELRHAEDGLRRIGELERDRRRLGAILGRISAGLSESEARLRRAIELSRRGARPGAREESRFLRLALDELAGTLGKEMPEAGIAPDVVAGAARSPHS
ncbi:MAG: protein kinase [Candidatus Schekmanbacteria bacterium]|nr:protein kinase [Candidatus Schekmanbacteria bacterium]